MSDLNTVTTPLDVFFAERAFSPRTEEQYRSLWMFFFEDSECRHLHTDRCAEILGNFRVGKCQIIRLH